MKRYILILTAVILLILDWLALDDITTGNEPNYFGEYGILFVSLIFFVYVGLTIFRNTNKS